MASELQELAQALAVRLRRPVAIDDPRMHLLAHTPHDGPVDEARLDSILRLQPSAEVIAWAHGYGIAQADAAVRLPAHVEYGLLSRVCAPIRSHDVLLGYVWIIDPDDTMTQDELALVEQTATSAGLIMYRDQLLDDLHRGRQRELLRDLLSNDEQVRVAACDALVLGEHLTPEGPYAAVVVQTRDTSDPDVAVTIEGALQRTARHVAPRSCVFVARADHGVLLVAHRKGSVRLADLRALGDVLREDTQARTGGRAYVGIGQPLPLSDALDSFEQARRAIQVAEIVPGFAPTMSWQDLGVYRVLVQLPVDSLGSDVIHPGLLRLVELDTAGQLVQTLEVYLDNAGDVRSTIAALSVHRTSLYYRLARIEELGGFSLSNGGERLAIHLGLKLLTLTGLRQGCTPSRAAKVTPSPAAPSSA